jgi:CheY-like chemotaxis protein
MGGRIEVDSVEGQGSAFWVELPLSRQAPRAEGTATPAPLPDDLARGRAGKAGGDGATATREATILYIEDNASNLALVKRIFDRWPGARLLVAMQGQPGLAMAREHRPDLLLLDLDLPDLPGEEVLRRWRADPATRAIPVVVVSADATPAQIARLRAAGARDYLTKPLDIARFLATVDEALAGPTGEHC